MNFDTIGPFVRHALQMIAGGLMAKGYIDAANSEILIGGVMSVATVAYWFLFVRTKPAVEE